ncbi:hypothetical protein VHUM_02226 [Vanrija humicola]|uniref:F-box domain-containing protein n=1 Tax=Vanrija humicola TaxID=5417 RepID=A0A7D8Z3P1_VANHU|nr:hypothetical protein VHUM_02226 [Vanrija humicola]
MDIRPQIHRLDAGHNALGNDGAVALFGGLTTQRMRYRRAEKGEPAWGMREVHMPQNNVGDEGLANAVQYASEDEELKSLGMQANGITVSCGLSALIQKLNKSHLTELRLSNNRLSPAAVEQLFTSLEAPHLRALHLSQCRLPAEVAPAIADYIASPRSYGLERLQLNANSLGSKGVSAIVDALQSSNFTLLHLGLAANSARARSSGSDDDWDSEEEWSSASDADSDAAACSQQTERRLPALLERNRILNRRVKDAATRALAPMRIILHALPPPEQGDVNEQDQLEKLSPEAATGENDANPVAPAQASSEPAPLESFPLLRLPQELQLVVARHCSGDAEALSEAQWTRIITYAGERASLKRMAERSRLALVDAATGPSRAARHERKAKMLEVLEEWRTRHRCDQWESNPMPANLW